MIDEYKKQNFNSLYFKYNSWQGQFFVDNQSAQIKKIPFPVEFQEGRMFEGRGRAEMGEQFQVHQRHNAVMEI